MTKQNTTTIRLHPGERVIVYNLKADGRETGQVFEIRSTAQPEETPNAHSVEIIEHVRDRENCCQVIFDCLSVPPDEGKVYEEILAQRRAERKAHAAEIDSFLEAISEVFDSAEIFTVDENGVRRHSSKPSSPR